MGWWENIRESTNPVNLEGSSEKTMGHTLKIHTNNKIFVFLSLYFIFFLKEILWRSWVPILKLTHINISKFCELLSLLLKYIVTFSLYLKHFHNVTKRLATHLTKLILNISHIKIYLLDQFPWKQESEWKSKNLASCNITCTNSMRGKTNIWMLYIPWYFKN